MSDRKINLVLSAKDEASGVFARAGQNIRRSTKQIQDAAAYGPAVKPRFSEGEEAIRQREAGILRARRAMQARERREAEVHNRLLVRDAVEGAGDAGGTIYGPAVKGRFDAHTQAVRNEQAAIIKSMRQQGQASRVQEEARIALFGAPEENEREGKKHGAKAGEGVAHGFLDALKGKFGRGSLLKEVTELAIGGGVVAGLSVLGEVAERATHGFADMANEIRDGEKPAEQIAQDFAESVPVLGFLVKSGDNLAEAFTGVHHALAEANKESAALDAHMAELKERNITFRNVGRVQDEALRGFADRRALAGLEGAPLEDRRAELAAEKERRDIEEKARQDRERFTGTGDADLQKMLAEQATKKHELEDAQAVYKEAVKKYGDGESFTAGTGEYGDAARGMNLQIVGAAKDRVEKLQRELAPLNQTLKDINDKTSIIDQQKQAAVNASKTTQDEETKARQQRRRRDDTRARERVNFESLERDRSATEAANEQRLRESGNYLNAELQQLLAAGEARKRAIVQQAKEEVQARMKALGETQQQAEAVVNPVRNRDVAANQRETDAAVRDRQVQARREQLDAERSFNRDLASTQAETIATRLRAAGAADDAEKVMRAEQHRQRLADIDEAAKKEAEAHGERAGEIEARRKALAGAEDDSYAADAAASEYERRKQFLPSFQTDLTSGLGLSGAVSAGAFQAQLNLQGQRDKAAEELSKLGPDVKSLLTQLIAAVKAGGLSLSVAPKPS